MNSPPTQLLTLGDGRLLEFARYGDPSGTPVLYFHGFLGSHHQASFAHTAAFRNGVQLVAANRPGVGRSTPLRRRAIVDYVADSAALMDSLNASTFGVIGVSGGVPYALACLAKLPERVRLGVLVSGLGPIADPAVLAQMNPFSRNALRLARRFPWLARAILAVRTKRVRANPESFVAALLRRWSRSDAAVFRRPEVRATILADILEVFVAGRPAEALAHELELYFRWGFQLEEIATSTRILLWHGRDDRLVPPFMSEHAARHLPGAEVVFQPGGHFMVIDNAEELVRHALAVGGDFFAEPARAT